MTPIKKNKKDNLNNNNIFISSDDNFDLLKLNDKNEDIIINNDKENNINLIGKKRKNLPKIYQNIIDKQISGNTIKSSSGNINNTNNNSVLNNEISTFKI